MKRWTVVVFMALLAGLSQARAETSTADGGSVRIDLGDNIAVNEGSSLRRVWVAVHDDLPLTIDGTPGVTTLYISGGRFTTAGYLYRANTTLTAGPDQAVTAFTFKFATIDVFGELMTTFSATEIQDIAADESKAFRWQWDPFRESEVERYFASIAFIDKVRTADGQVHQADYGAVLEAVSRFAKEATEADLEPPSDKP